MRKPSIRVACFALCLGSASTSPPIARAQEPSNTWQWSITPYLWAAGTKGRVGARDVIGSVDITTGDVLRSGDVAFMAALEGHRGRWLARLDAFYVSTTDDEDLAPVLGKPSTLHIEQYQTMLARAARIRRDHRAGALWPVRRAPDGSAPRLLSSSLA